MLFNDVCFLLLFLFLTVNYLQGIVLEKIGEFKGGTFKIALKSHCPIVPVAMIDCYQVFDNNTIKPVKAQIHYLKPIEYDEYKDLKTPEIAALVQSRIQACMDEYC